ncbi:MAG: hypothetical protein GWP09_00190 [Nitrospiraceae bacterium]|nr:hypothetical protein [Nitrospiraceae bacterium]
MNKMNLLLTFGIIVSVLMSFGLSSCGPNPPPTQQISVYPAGTSGLVLSWEGDSDSNYLYPNSGFSWIVDVENKGYANVKEGSGYYALGGILPSAYGIDKPSGSFPDSDLQGIRFNGDGSQVVSGDLSQIVISGTGYKSNVNGPSQKTVTLTYCYPYNTSVSAQVCVSNFQQGGVKVCNDRGAIPYSVSASPLTVSSVTERSSKLGDGSSFKATITFTVGYPQQHTGQIFDPDYPNCGLSHGSDPNLMSRKKNILSYTASLPNAYSGYTVSCKGSRDNKMHIPSTGSSVITCEITGPIETTSFTMPLNLVLNYNYEDYLTKTFTLESN